MQEQIIFIDQHNEPIDNFVNVTAGDPFRLFPYGVIRKGDRTINITKEYAARFKLPNVTPPIKKGTHADEAPAVGHIVSLEVREDGLYGVPEYTEEGRKVIERGDYKYHSPEVIWSGYYEDKDGRIEGPLIVGTALLHMPYLGEEAALYSCEIQTSKENDMTEEVKIPKNLLEKMSAFFSREPEEDTVNTEAIQTERDQFKAERDDLQAKLDELQAEKQQADALAAIKAEFATDEFGAAYMELGQAEEAAQMLASMTDEQRAWTLKNFKALSGQIQESKLTDPEGDDGEGLDDLGPADLLSAKIKQYQDEHSGATYTEAFSAVLAADKDLAAVFTRRPGKEK